MICNKSNSFYFRIVIFLYFLKLRCNVAPENRNTEVLFDADWAYIIILIVLMSIGGFIGK